MNDTTTAGAYAGWLDGELTDAYFDPTTGQRERARIQRELQRREQRRQWLIAEMGGAGI